MCHIPSCAVDYLETEAFEQLFRKLRTPRPSSIPILTGESLPDHIHSSFSSGHWLIYKNVGLAQGKENNKELTSKRV